MGMWIFAKLKLKASRVLGEVIALELYGANEWTINNTNSILIPAYE